MGNPPGTRDRWAWCLFHSGARPYAVRLDAVAEIVDADGLVRLPLSPPRVLGLFTLRRDVVPVIRMTEGQDEDSGGLDTRLVVLILRTEGGVWGIRVDRGTTVGVEETLIDPGGPPSAEDGPEGARTVVRGGTTFAVVDLESAWREVRATIEGWYGSQGGFVVEAGAPHPPSGPLLPPGEGNWVNPLPGSHCGGSVAGGGGDA